MTDNTERKPPYSAQEVADTLGISKSTVIEAANRGSRNWFRVGAPVALPAAPIDKGSRGNASFAAIKGAAGQAPALTQT